MRVLLVAVEETAGSALYGMLDVLSAAGTLWNTMVGAEAGAPLFNVGIVADQAGPLRCGNRIPVDADVGADSDPAAEIVVVPEIWLDPQDSFAGRHPRIVDWLRRCHRRGSHLYSACSGAILLAETGLLEGCDATSHWGYEDFFRRHYPGIRFRPEPSLAFADPSGRIVTAGGTTSWHDLALHLIARHAGAAEAIRISRLYLLKWHDEGQLPYAALVRRSPHADAVVRRCEQWLAGHHAERDALAGAVRHAGIPERTLKRRFRTATGTTLTARLQDTRVEAAKQLLQSGRRSIDDIAAQVGYEDASFFRRLFRRRVGVSPVQYRRMFNPGPRPSSGK